MSEAGPPLDSTDALLRFQTQLLDAVGHPLVATDLDGIVTYWNPAAVRTYGWTIDDVVGRRLSDILVTDQSSAQALASQHAVAHGESWSGEFTVQHKDGTMIPVVATNKPIFDDRGNAIGVIGTSVDISALVQAEQQAGARAAQHAAIAAIGEVAVIEHDLDSLLQSSCEHAADALSADFVSLLRLEDEAMLRLVAGVGFSDEYLGSHLVPLGDRSMAGYTLQTDEVTRVDDLDAEARFEHPWLLAEYGLVTGMSVVLRTGQHAVGVLGAYRRDPRPFAEEDANVLKSIGNVVAHAIEREESRRTLSRMAMTDELTGLPNRATLMDQLEHSLARRRTHHLALLYAGLDDFKDVNDAMGHDVGDQVLRLVAARLGETAREGDTIARLGGDEFAIICEDVPDAEFVRSMADRLIHTLNSRPIRLDDRSVRVDASIGVVIADAESTAAGLVQDADTAMYVAKAGGGSRVRFFDAEMRSAIIERVGLIGDLRDALTRSELEVHFQPEVGLHDDTLWVEALVRWRHRTKGLLAPAAFIGMAEDTGLIVPIGQWVLEQAVAQLARWNAMPGGHLPTSVSVNLSASQLVEGDFVSFTAEVLDRHRLDPASLWFELTETALLREPERSIEALHGLKRLGVGLAIDDFGTGYSSFAYARSLPMDAVKIDRSFVSGMGAHLKDDGIVRAVIGLATSFGILSVAEGVETEEQLEALRALGCDLAQGYLFLRPGPAAEVETWCRTRAAPN